MHDVVSQMVRIGGGAFDLVRMCTYFAELHDEVLHNSVVLVKYF